ncbi:helix-turn-helix domain-containing protein [Nonomuraea jiangxiensis]|uniref:Putative transposase n=1 Tax=Nonomuraea jiangxiensis TaxID=633440 RepID=A0A1G8QEJ1_9ACTN|nr:helix-turn-helix domain-containing protein [Nonomuraea jiangxiensis]SDJ02520.1 putative transposase [Nonomuraea jiangxiensis]
MSAEPPDAVPAAPPGDTPTGATDATPVALARYRVLVPHLYEGVTLKAAAASSGVPYRTAQRWLAAYKRDGLLGLARAGRSDKGRRRLPEELIAFIEGLALKPPRPTIAKIHRQAVGVAAQRGQPKPAPPWSREFR